MGEGIEAIMKEKKGKKRKSKNGKINKEDKRLISFFGGERMGNPERTYEGGQRGGIYIHKGERKHGKACIRLEIEIEIVLEFN